MYNFWEEFGGATTFERGEDPWHQKYLETLVYET
jgi:hypothetical protein